MNLLHVGAFPFPTGHGSQVHLAGSAAGLARRGHRVSVACYAAGAGAPPPELHLARARALPGVRFVESGWHWSKPAQDLLLTRVIRREVRAGAQVVHAHNVEAALVARAALGPARPGVPPLVFDLHAVMETELPQWFPERRWAGPAGRLVDRLVARAADAGLAISEEGGAFLRRMGVARVAVIPPGVEPSELEGGDAARARSRWALDGRPWVAYVGNTDPYQDLPDLLAAVAAAPEVGLLVVAGSGVAALTVAADRAGISPERRRLIESRDFADARDALAAADVAALPRRVCPGFPIKLLNYLGAGLPVVAAPGSAQPIAGVVVADGVPATVDALRALAADPARRRALGQAARAAVLDGWTRGHQAARLEALYADLLASRA